MKFVPNDTTTRSKFSQADKMVDKNEKESNQNHSRKSKNSTNFSMTTTTVEKQRNAIRGQQQRSRRRQRQQYLITSFRALTTLCRIGCSSSQSKKEKSTILKGSLSAWSDNTYEESTCGASNLSAVEDPPWSKEKIFVNGAPKHSDWWTEVEIFDGKNENSVVDRKEKESCPLPLSDEATSSCNVSEVPIVNGDDSQYSPSLIDNEIYDDVVEVGEDSDELMKDETIVPSSHKVVVFNNCGYIAWVQVREAWRRRPFPEFPESMSTLTNEIVSDADLKESIGVSETPDISEETDSATPLPLTVPTLPETCQPSGSVSSSRSAKNGKSTMKYDRRRLVPAPPPTPAALKKELVDCLREQRQFELSRGIPLRDMIEAYCEVWASGDL